QRALLGAHHCAAQIHAAWPRYWQPHVSPGSIVRLDRSLDDLRLFPEKLRQRCSYEVRCESHRLVRAGHFLEDAEGSALAGSCIQPVVADETLGLADNGDEFVLDEPIDRGAIFRVEMVVTDHSKHAPSCVGDCSQ